MWNIPPWWPNIFPPNTRPAWEIKPGLSHEELTQLRELLQRERSKTMDPPDEVLVKRKVLKKIADELGVAIQFV